MLRGSCAAGRAEGGRRQETNSTTHSSGMEAASSGAYTLQELLRDASGHALPVGPDSAASAARVHELLSGVAAEASAAASPELQNPAPLPNTLLKVETLARVFEAVGLIVASRVRALGRHRMPLPAPQYLRMRLSPAQLGQGRSVKVRGLCLFFLRRFGHGIRLPQFRERGPNGS